MKCPYCGSDSKITETASDVDRVIRIRRCKSSDCGNKFYTEESDIGIAKGKRLFNNIRKENIANEKKRIACTD